MTEMVEPPRSGRGRPGVKRAGVKQTPTERQPNRGRKPGDPFTCVGCREKFPAEDEYVLGGKPQGRCAPCGKAKRREINDRRAAKKRGPDYVLPVSKEELFPVVDGQRACSECGKVQPVSEFYSDRTVASGLQNVCKGCRSVQRSERWHNLSPEQKTLVQTQSWRAWIWRHFWLSPEAYDELALAQGGVCAICEEESEVRLCVDHDHACCPGEYTCGKCVRQLLCHMCNFTIGGIERVGSADPFDAYLARHATNRATTVVD